MHTVLYVPSFTRVPNWQPVGTSTIPTGRRSNPGRISVKRPSADTRLVVDSFDTLEL